MSLPPELLDLIVVTAVVMIVAMFVWMLRREDLLVTIEPDGLSCGPRLLRWEGIERLVYVRGAYGAMFRLVTAQGAAAFRDEQLDQHPDRVRDRIVNAARLVVAPVQHVGPEMRSLPGDTVQEFALPELAEAAYAQLQLDFEEQEQEALGDAEDLADTDERAETVRRLGVGAATVALLLAKFGTKLWALLKGAGGLVKFGQLWPTALSLGVTVWAFAVAWGWWFAGGLVALILVHEIGHAVVMRAKGLRTGPIVFIPFMGAFIAVKDQFRDALVEAETAYGGPAAGALAATACFAVWRFTSDAFALREYFLGMAYVGFLFNLFNLLPVSPLDGGRVVTAISPLLWVLGLAVAAYLAFTLGHPILILVVILGALRAWSTWKQRDADPPATYFEVTPVKRALITGAYFGLCAYLGFMTLTAQRLSGMAAT